MNVLSLFDGLSGGRLALGRAGIKCDKYFASEVDKYAIAVTQYNFPDTIQLGDVREVYAKDLPKIDLLIGGSPCFVAGTKIICEDGYKNIEDVVVGDLVLTHKGRFKKVLAIGNEKKETYKLKAQGVFDTETTDNHPYYVREMYRKWNNDIRSSYRYFPNPIWKPVINIKKDDFVGMPILKKEVNSLGITNEEAYIIGRYVADGHTRKDYRDSENRPNHRHWQLILSIGADKLNKFKQQVTENKFSCYPHTKNVYRCVFSSKKLVKIVEKHCGCGAFNKKLSMELLNLPVDILDSLLTGYLDGDGSVRGDEIRANSISKELMQTMGLAIVKIYKVPVACGKTKRLKTTLIEGREVNQHNSYEISFRKAIKKQTKAYVDNDFVWTRFKSTEKTNEIKTVYNISVEDDESYVANNLVVHNCQGFSLAGKQLNFDDPRSKLFFEFVRLLKECNPKYFLLENVKMKKEYQDVITEHLGRYLYPEEEWEIID